jgi:adenosylmethionine-8-amino-7-oxononanoate aminotransferase
VIARAGAGSVAAVLVEPVTGSLTGALTGPDGWLAAARQVCRQHGILMIADETMSGFGRTGAWFATDHGGPPAVPDILVAGKLMTSGHFPLTTVTVTEAVARVLQAGPAGWPVRFTNAGHPVACAAALAVISRIEREGLVGNAARQGGYLRGLLAGLAAARPYLGTPTGRGLQLGVPVRRPAGASRADAAGLLADITRAGVQRHGILLTGGTGADGASVKVLFTPPLSVTAADCREIAERFAATVDDVVRRRYGDSAP